MNEVLSVSHNFDTWIANMLKSELISRSQSFVPVLHFWWNPFVHTLHLAGTMLERKAAKHFAHFSLELLDSAVDKPWFKRDFNDGGVGRGGKVSGWVGWCPLAGVEECRWQSQVRVERMQALALLLGFTKPLHVAARWQTLSQDGFAQW